MAYKSASDRLSEWGDGCDVTHHCLACPLRQCRFDHEHTFWSDVYRARRTILATYLAQGLTVKEVAKRTGVTIRTVWKAKAEAKRRDWPQSPEALAGLLRVKGGHASTTPTQRK